MAEYIECEKYVKLNDIIETLEHEWGYEGMREDLYNLPTADVVEVVRCKGCMWWYPREYGSVIGRCENPYNGLATEYIEEDEFCSYGKRKEGAEE